MIRSCSLCAERNRSFIQPRQGATITLEKIVSFLKSKGASVLQLPERVECIDSMPVRGAKRLVDKKALLEDIKRKLA